MTAIARQVDRVLRERGWLCEEERVGQQRFVTSGDLDQYQQVGQRRDQSFSSKVG